MNQILEELEEVEVVPFALVVVAGATQLLANTIIPSNANIIPKVRILVFRKLRLLI
jgi:hypothetical protein